MKKRKNQPSNSMQKRKESENNKMICFLNFAWQNCLKLTHKFSNNFFAYSIFSLFNGSKLFLLLALYCHILLALYYDIFLALYCYIAGFVLSILGNSSSLLFTGLILLLFADAVFLHMASSVLLHLACIVLSLFLASITLLYS